MRHMSGEPNGRTLVLMPGSNKQSRARPSSVAPWALKPFLATQVIAGPSAAHMASTTYLEEWTMTENRGIGGWLLVFILWLALSSGLNLLVELRQNGVQAKRDGRIRCPRRSDNRPTGSQATVRQSIAKTVLGFEIVMLMLEIGQLKTSPQGSRLGGSIIICCLWFAYLTKSERVRNTFGST
jgi:hypothetical protein